MAYEAAQLLYNEAVSKGDPDKRSRAALSRAPALCRQLRSLGGSIADRADSELVPAVAQLRETVQERTGPCRIACVGRTRAGKSTLRFVLTGEAEEGIGRGGQRTTTENLEYRWHDVVMVDTPGVGAFRGQVDVRLASEAAAGADLILWLVGSDGVQLATVVPVLEMAERGVPVLALVNHKETHDLAELSRVQEDRMFTDREARERRIRDLLDRADMRVLHMQLDVARLARLAGDTYARSRSRLDLFETVLEEAAADALSRRGEVRTTRVARALDLLQRILREVGSDLEESIASTRIRADELEARRATVRQSFDEKLERAVAAAFGTAHGLLGSACEVACTEEDVKAAKHAFNLELNLLSAAYIEDSIAGTHSALTSAQREMADVEPGPIDPANLLAHEHFDFELRGDPATARALTTVRRVVSAGSGLLFFTPVGWAARIAMGVAPFVLEAVGTTLSPSVDEEREKRQSSVEEVRAQVSQQLRQIDDEVRADADRRFGVAVDAPLERARLTATAEIGELTRVLTSVDALREIVT